MKTRGLFVCLFLAACGGVPNAEADNLATTHTLDAAEGPPIAFSAVYAQVLTPCATACHFTGTTETTTLFMDTQASTYAVLLGKTLPSESTSTPYITPKNVNESFLYLKVTGDPSVGPRMPLGSAALGDSEIAELASWINGGALNN